ncbi:MAG: lipopolysaccharide biosynthesis protein [Planctomycetes bacterium]|nr:lipopolysaccharide biosynthesis protein [Planctomycetota bacterium]
MSSELKRKAAHGVLWSFIERFGQQGVQFIISIILARLLVPKEFGLIGMLVIFTAIAQTFLDSGFGSALIQKKNATHIDECSIFYFNILIGFAAAGLMCLISPWIGAFYNEPKLVPLTRFLSLNLIINSFGLIQTTLLTKNVDFKSQLKVGMTATVISGGIGIFLALRGFGVWSLAIQIVSASLLRAILLWWIGNWRPAAKFSYRSLRSMFSFGSKLLFSGLLDQIFMNIYLVVIGKIFTVGDLGYYVRAKSWQQLTTQNITSVVTRVAFPVFSSIQNDNLHLKRGMKKALSFLALANFPLMIGILVTARPVVLLLLTDKWAESIPYLQLLCLVGLMYPIHSINLNLLMAKGRSDLFFRLEIIKKALIVISIFVTYRWGISAMIWGQIIVSIAGLYINTFFTARMIDYPIMEQLWDMTPYLFAAVLMGAVVYSLKYVPFESVLSLFLTQAIVGVVVYIGLCRIFRLSAFEEIRIYAAGKLTFLQFA